MYAPGVVSAETVPGRAEPVIPDNPEVNESGIMLENGMLPRSPPVPPPLLPEPPAAYATPPVPSIPDTAPAI